MIYSTTTKILEQWFVIININRGLEDNQEMFNSKFKALTIRILKGIGDNWDYKFKVFFLFFYLFLNTLCFYHFTFGLLIYYLFFAISFFVFSYFTFFLEKNIMFFSLYF